VARKLRIAPACYHVLHLIPIQIAHEMNFFYDEGLRDEDGKPTYEIVRGGMAPFMFEKETLAQRMKELNVDVAMDVKPSTVAYLQRQGHELYIVAGWRNNMPHHLVSDGSIDSIEKLKGKRVGVIDLEDIFVTVLRPWLKRAGLDPYADVKWVRGNNPSNAGARLRAGLVDAIFQDPSDAEVLRGEGFSDLFDIAAHYPKGRPDRVNVATAKALQEKPDMVKACIKGMIRAYWYMRKQPDTFNQCLQVERRLRMESPDLDEQRRKPTCESPKHVEHLPFPYNGVPTNLEGYLQEAVEVGVLDEPPDMEKLGQLKLVQEGFIELEAREDLKEDLDRIKKLVGRLGY
jgi:ABC-type nitrate/sulfonate/bicarbonate transport system substrate-binding protein